MCKRSHSLPASPTGCPLYLGLCKDKGTDTGGFYPPRGHRQEAALTTTEDAELLHLSDTACKISSITLCLSPHSLFETRDYFMLGSFLRARGEPTVNRQPTVFLPKQRREGHRPISKAEIWSSRTCEQKAFRQPQGPLSIDYGGGRGENWVSF